MVYDKHVKDLGVKEDEDKKMQSIVRESCNRSFQILRDKLENPSKYIQPLKKGKAENDKLMIMLFHFGSIAKDSREAGNVSNRQRPFYCALMSS